VRIVLVVNGLTLCRADPEPDASTDHLTKITMPASWPRCRVGDPAAPGPRRPALAMCTPVAWGWQRCV
jgi:hypothetical protein